MFKREAELLISPFILKYGGTWGQRGKTQASQSEKKWSWWGSRCSCVSRRRCFSSTYLVQTESSSCLFCILLEAGVSSLGCFRSLLTVWRNCVLPRAKCSSQTHRVLLWKPGTSWRMAHIKHGDIAVPSMREVADSGPFLICLQVHASAGKGVLLSDARRLACSGLP